jgi:hypothetical protein
MIPLIAFAIDNKGIVNYQHSDNYFSLISSNHPATLVIDDDANSAVRIAAENLSADFAAVCGQRADIVSAADAPAIYIGTADSRIARQSGLDLSALKGKRETYILEVSNNSIYLIGSDRRGAVYGIYELSEQIGVSPWHDWADVPVEAHSDIAIRCGRYSNGEPAVTYRGIFLNDEAPSLTTWVKNTYGTDYGDHRFYARVFELILRLRGNFLWPAMWSWAFYADDELNSRTADEMGVIIGTSHHEPMARNHQEYARRRDYYGAWNYSSNRTSLDQFFTEGIERIKGTEDVVTIGMRGDGDEAMSQEADVALLKQVIKNQRAIIKRVTGKPADRTPQVWALYKEVLDYYDQGLRAPDDVMYLLCDDNWGNIRRLPTAAERRHPGGWGMYYHVDYVGAPRNSKWLNCTPIQNLYEQMQLTYSYGVDRMWILNVGDLKPMEYPITLFLDMAWNPTRFTPDNLSEHTLDFCAQQFGNDQAAEAARILNLYCKYAGRVTPEMLDRNTYNLATGEWQQVVAQFAQLEVEALRQYVTLTPDQRDAYKQLILFPVQAMANLYDMYYAQAMNHQLYSLGDSQANVWADRVQRDFLRDASLIADYNNVMSSGKWQGMMSQKHIGYTSWNDDFAADTMPEVFRLNDDRGGYQFRIGQGFTAIEAEHYLDAEGSGWTVIPDMGRTLSGIALMPYTDQPAGQQLRYRLALPDTVKQVTVHVIVKSTLAFSRLDGHRYEVALDSAAPQVINFNSQLNEQPENIYSQFYPTVARRVVENTATFEIPVHGQTVDLTLRPLDPGIVFEKIVVDYGGYSPSYLFGNETIKFKN